MLPRIKAHTHPMSFGLGRNEIIKIQHFENLFSTSKVIYSELFFIKYILRPIDLTGDVVLAVVRVMFDYCNLFKECYIDELSHLESVRGFLTFRRYL